MEPRAREPKNRKAQTAPRLQVQTQKKFHEEGGSLQSKPTQVGCWVETQGSMLQLQRIGALLQRLFQVQSEEWGL